MTAGRARAGRTIVILGLLLGGLLTAGCGGDPGRDPGEAASPSPHAARALTATEAERLAVTRFRNYDAGTRSVDAAYNDDGHEVSLAGYFDYTTHTGYATVSADGTPTDAIAWNGAVVAISPQRPVDAGPGDPPASVQGWAVGALDPTRSALETVLAVLAALGADRPENPLLLARSGALWLREDTVEGAPVTVFAGPPAATSARLATPGPSAPGPGTPESRAPASGTPDPDAASIRYWVDETGLALRIEIRLGDAWATVDLADGDGVTVPALPAAAPGPGGPA